MHISSSILSSAILLGVAGASFLTLQQLSPNSTDHLIKYTKDQVCQNRNILLSSLIIEENNYCPVPSHSSKTYNGTYQPWDKPPHCLITDRTEYCVYTLSTFSQNRGISLITTPRTAATIALSPGLHSPPNSYPQLGMLAPRPQTFTLQIPQT